MDWLYSYIVVVLIVTYIILDMDVCFIFGIAIGVFGDILLWTWVQSFKYF